MDSDDHDSTYNVVDRAIQQMNIDTDGESAGAKSKGSKSTTVLGKRIGRPKVNEPVKKFIEANYQFKSTEATSVPRRSEYEELQSNHSELRGYPHDAFRRLFYRMATEAHDGKGPSTIGLKKREAKAEMKGVRAYKKFHNSEVLQGIAGYLTDKMSFLADVDPNIKDAFEALVEVTAKPGDAVAVENATELFENILAKRESSFTRQF